MTRSLSTLRTTCLSLLATVLIFAPACAQKSVPLQALSGEYNNAVEPDTPLSFYVSGGKLMAESERRVPVQLKQISANEFSIPNSKNTYCFEQNAAAHTITVVNSAAPEVVYSRTGEAVHHIFHDYQRREVMIPMRDGVRLHAIILKPADIATPLPFLISRTPYGVDRTSRDLFFSQRPELARAGYIYVEEDIRGRYKSEGEFVMSRPLADHSNPKTVDESTDAYDTVAWLLANVDNNNGRAGFIGTSYPGFLAMAAGIDPHPAVKAISPQAPMIDVWMGDDFFHNGAFRQTYGYDYVIGLESSKEDTEVSYGKDKNGQPRDGYDFFLERGSFATDVHRSGSRMLPTWKLFLEHPAYDSYWSSRNVVRSLMKVAVPTLTVGGYYDQEDMYGPQAEYAALEPHDASHQNFLVLGPWRHGYWSSSARHLGNLDYGQSIGKEYRTEIEAKFFAHYLKDESGFQLEDTASFRTGSNTWQHYASFPPKTTNTQQSILYLAGEGKLSWSKPETSATTSYVSDPANPVPYRHRPIQPTYGEGSQWFNWMTEDQSFVADRKDVAVFKLPALKKDLIVTGDVKAEIYASTTGTDNDMIVKLIDQYPDDDPDPRMRGYQLITNAEIFRGRYLHSFEDPAPIAANSVQKYNFSLHAVDHVFKAGHTIVVEIQSSWFPLYDRNPQTFVSNIMSAKPEDYKPATIILFATPEYQSHIHIPALNLCEQATCSDQK